MAASRHVETERKYDVADSSVLPVDQPDLGYAVGAVTHLQLEAVYFDTTDLGLQRRGITLRRRTGGDDAGWHVKVPRGRDQKTEIRHPLGRTVKAVPPKVVDPVRAIVRDQPLVPVATITTDRTASTLVDGEEPVALLCDDRVSCRGLLTHPGVPAPGVADQGLADQGPDGPADQDPPSWREWELEVVEGRSPRPVLASIEPYLLDAGARRSDHRSKLGRVAAHHGRDQRRTGPERGPRRGPKDGIGELLGKRLVQQISALHQQDAALRSGSPEGVHRMRIATRRLRSALTTAKPLFTEPPDGLREELRWLGRVLGPARDAQVIRERLEAALDAQPRDLVLGPVRRRLRAELLREQRQSLATAREALDSVRYYRLLDALDALSADLPMASAVHAQARFVMADLVKRDAKRLKRAVQAVADSDPGHHDHAMHEARKKAKRLRYAAELATPAGGRRAKRLARQAKAVQQALGHHQDTVVARQRLRQLGAQSFLHGENGFTFGLLHGLERGRAERAEVEFQRAWNHLPRPRTAAAWVSKK